MVYDLQSLVQWTYQELTLEENFSSAMEIKARWERTTVLHLPKYASSENILFFFFPFKICAYTATLWKWRPFTQKRPQNSEHEQSQDLYGVGQIKWSLVLFSIQPKERRSLVDTPGRGRFLPWVCMLSPCAMWVLSHAHSGGLLLSALSIDSCMWRTTICYRRDVHVHKSFNLGAIFKKLHFQWLWTLLFV